MNQLSLSQKTEANQSKIQNPAGTKTVKKKEYKHMHVNYTLESRQDLDQDIKQQNNTPAHSKMKHKTSGKRERRG